MELLEVYRYPAFAEQVVYAAKFKNVRNAGQIRARIVKAAAMSGAAGNDERDAVNFAFINATLITSPLHLQTAAVQALYAESEGSLRTRTVHSEIIWNLNPSNNITEAFRRYGVSDATTDLLVVHVAPGERQDVLERMRAVVDGELDLVANVSEVTDWTTVIKHYRLDQEPAFQGVTGCRAAERELVDKIVVGAVATKSIAA